MKLKRLIFHVGGPEFHPVGEQAPLIVGCLGERYHCILCEGLAAFDALKECDLLVLMGLHWTGMKRNGLTYHPMQDRHKRAFEQYVASGRPLLAHHGAIASYDDWPRFGELIGFTWVWGRTTHSPVGAYTINVLPTGHPVIDGVRDYTLADELYYNVRLTPGAEPAVHAQVLWEGAQRPMVSTLEGGRTRGAGKVVYLANGHNMRAFECPAIARLWQNSVRWLTS